MTAQWQAGDQINCDLSFTKIELDTTAGIPEGYIAGIASTPSVDRHGHRILAKAFDESIKEKGLGGASGVQLLAGHDWNKVAGKITKLETVNDSLLLNAQLYLNVSYVKDLHEVLKQNGGLNFSVGFGLQDFEFIDEDQQKSADDPWLIIKKGDLMEVSIVTFPSCKDARMTFVKEVDTMADFERALVADGICQNRSHAHKIARWAMKNVHLLQPKPPLLEEKASTSPHPLLDVSMLKPMAELLAKAKAQLT